MVYFLNIPRQDENEADLVKIVDKILSFFTKIALLCTGTNLVKKTFFHF
jgi:hypothetical protein